MFAGARTALLSAKAAAPAVVVPSFDPNNIFPDPGFSDPAAWQDSAVSSPTQWLVSGGTASYPGGPGGAWELDSVASVSVPAGDYKITGVASASTGVVVGIYSRGAVTNRLAWLYFPAGASTQVEGFTVPSGATGFTIRVEGSVGTVSLDSLQFVPGTYSASHTYGSNVFANGTFNANDATGWTLTRCSISGNALNVVNTSGFIGNAVYTLPGGMVDGGLYVLEFDIINFVGKSAGGTYSAFLGSNNIGNYVPANGHFTMTGIAGSANDDVRFNVLNNSNFQIDNATLVQRLT